MKEIIGWGSRRNRDPDVRSAGLQAMAATQREFLAHDALVFHPGIGRGIRQVVYSWMLGNWVYFSVNVCLVITDTLGLALAIRGRWVNSSLQQAVPHDGATGVS